VQDRAGDSCRGQRLLEQQPRRRLSVNSRARAARTVSASTANSPSSPAGSGGSSESPLEYAAASTTQPTRGSLTASARAASRWAGSGASTSRLTASSGPSPSRARAPGTSSASTAGSTAAEAGHSAGSSPPARPASRPSPSSAISSRPAGPSKMPIGWGRCSVPAAVGTVPVAVMPFPNPEALRARPSDRTSAPPPRPAPRVVAAQPVAHRPVVEHHVHHTVNRPCSSTTSVLTKGSAAVTVTRPARAARSGPARRPGGPWPPRPQRSAGPRTPASRPR